MALLAFFWSVAEATIWPIMPDALLVPLALRRPSAWWRLVAGAALGTAVGGAISYQVGRRQASLDAVLRLPLVRPAMVVAADRWLTAEGPRGVWRQPATGIPFKVFARVAGARALPPGRFLGWAVAARSGRFLVLVGLAALVRQRSQELVARRYWWMTLAWSLAFGLALARLVRFWGARTADRAAS